MKYFLLRGFDSTGSWVMDMITISWSKFPEARVFLLLDNLTRGNYPLVKLSKPFKNGLLDGHVNVVVEIPSGVWE